VWLFIVGATRHALAGNDWRAEAMFLVRVAMIVAEVL